MTTHAVLRPISLAGAVLAILPSLLSTPPASAGATPAHAPAAPAPAAPEPTLQALPVAGNIHVLIGRGGNIGVSAGEDGILIVDDQFAPAAPEIRAALARIAPGKLAFVLNTHHHGDHVGGNEIFGAEATIIAHDNVRKRLVAGGKPAVALPIVTFNDALSLHFNGEEIRAIHAASGHTDGDSVIWFTGSNVVHMGDHFFNGKFPFVDLASGGSVDGYIANVAAALAKIPADARIIPGHGPLATREELRVFHAMLTETTAFVRKRAEAGLDAAAIKALGLDEKWASWDGGFISAGRWIDTILDSPARE